MQICTGGPGTDAHIVQIADAVDAAGIGPEDSQQETQGAGDNEEEDNFITLGDAEYSLLGIQVVPSVTVTDIRQTTATGTPSGPPKLFESDDEESDAQLGDKVEAILVGGGPLEVPDVVDSKEGPVRRL